MDGNTIAKEYQKLLKKVVDQRGERAQLMGGKRKTTKRKMSKKKSKKKSKRAGGVTGGRKISKRKGRGVTGGRKLSKRKLSKRKLSKRKLSKRIGRGVTGGKRMIGSDANKRMSRKIGSGVTGGNNKMNKQLASYLLQLNADLERTKMMGRGNSGGYAKMENGDYLMKINTTGGCCNCMHKPSCPMAKSCHGGSLNNKLEKMLIKKHKGKPKNLKRYREILEDVKLAKKYKAGCSTSPSIQQIRKIASEINKKI